MGLCSRMGQHKNGHVCPETAHCSIMRGVAEPAWFRIKIKARQRASLRDCRAGRLLRYGDFDIREALVPKRPLQVLVGLLRGGFEESGLFCGDLFVSDHLVDFLFDHRRASCDVGDFQNLAGGPGDFLKIS